jgi:bacteriocin-like protein
MKNDFKKLSLKKLTIARISTNELKSIEGGSSIPPTDQDPDLSILTTMEIHNCIESHSF